MIVPSCTAMLIFYLYTLHQQLPVKISQNMRTRASGHSFSQDSHPSFTLTRLKYFPIVRQIQSILFIFISNICCFAFTLHTVRLWRVVDIFIFFSSTVRMHLTCMWEKERTDEWTTSRACAEEEEGRKKKKREKFMNEKKELRELWREASNFCVLHKCSNIYTRRMRETLVSLSRRAASV